MKSSERNIRSTRDVISCRYNEPDWGLPEWGRELIIEKDSMGSQEF